MEDAEKKAYRLGESLAEDIRTGKIYRKQKRKQNENRKYFQNLVKLYKDEWVYEYKYWDKQSRQ
jgi:hypothetical protein